MRAAFRALRIARVLLRHRLGDLLENTGAGPWLRVLRPFTPPRSEEAKLPRGERLRLALQELGPIFVKFGQVLSTRRDLLPADIADQLALLRDQVAPFPGAQARAEIERALGKPVAELFQLPICRSLFCKVAMDFELAPCSSSMPSLSTASALLLE